MKYIGRFRKGIIYLVVVLIITPSICCAQPLNKKNGFTRQDTLRGSVTPERAWWDVTSYAITVSPDYKKKTISGVNTIGFYADGNDQFMQIDLQEPMMIDSAFFEGRKLNYKRDGNVYYLDFGKSVVIKRWASHTIRPTDIRPREYAVKIFFHGKPKEAVNAPWDGGWIFSKDEKGRPWMTVACQGLGASVWYPCKDYQGDEPLGASLSIIVPDTLVAVANGKLYSKNALPDHKTAYTWSVSNPINNYNIVPYIGKYVEFTDTFMSEGNRPLSLDYWVLDYNLEKAKKQFTRDVKPMLQAFEYWFGPYPFYEDGFKLVESSHLGMEHQSAVAYGNHYMNGYLGQDLSGSGWGLKWDYIIVHESGHEWFANNITTKDIADMWVHEGFTMYSEALFVEYHYGKKAADEYVQGIRNHIENDVPLIGPYGVNKEGSGDMYNKGANMLHTIRQVIDNDTVFRKILRGMNSRFYHATVTTGDIEKYMIDSSGKDLRKIFDQYLRTVRIPVLEYKVEGDRLSYRWNNTVAGFNMPLRLADGKTWIYPSPEWKTTTVSAANVKEGLMVDKNFYIMVKKVQ